MSKIAVVYYSGYGHTKLIAELVAESAKASLIAIDSNGDITDADWETLNAADGIIFGAPTYMGNAPWQFKNSPTPALKSGSPAAGRTKYSAVSSTALA